MTKDKSGKLQVQFGGPNVIANSGEDCFDTIADIQDYIDGKVDGFAQLERTTKIFDSICQELKQYKTHIEKTYPRCLKGEYASVYAYSERSMNNLLQKCIAVNKDEKLKQDPAEPSNLLSAQQESQKGEGGDEEVTGLKEKGCQTSPEPAEKCSKEDQLGHEDERDRTPNEGQETNGVYTSISQPVPLTSNNLGGTAAAASEDKPNAVESDQSVEPSLGDSQDTEIGKHSDGSLQEITKDSLQLKGSPQAGDLGNINILSTNSPDSLMY
ncbi:hypothetical protein POVWA2_038950 [Plasmodium ovale wallikeri]|uniref:PIR Superfamily Protein n=1 Tax=Plasmodium ovale wallikeri TaxID=864142 RepID=A0A1A8Z8A5_PLAOA|nr:hypothetical protein POVWA1_040180 [Plasmodium ovale wallikeri]SBT40016.1 hypothetical protein POVWA2_038950 [Plasmodium ovale wallikeri]